MNIIRSSFTLKGNKIEDPDVYLGSSLINMGTADGDAFWTMLSEKYYNTKVDNVEKVLPDHRRCLLSKCKESLEAGYRPELDISME